MDFVRQGILWLTVFRQFGYFVGYYYIWHRTGIFQVLIHTSGRGWTYWICQVNGGPKNLVGFEQHIIGPIKGTRKVKGIWAELAFKFWGQPGTLLLGVRFGAFGRFSHFGGLNFTLFLRFLPEISQISEFRQREVFSLLISS